MVRSVRAGRMISGGDDITFREGETLELKEIVSAEIQRGTGQSVFRDQKEFGGSLLQQLGKRS